jgi:methionine biosynthesis protein MetW
MKKTKEIYEEYWRRRESYTEQHHEESSPNEIIETVDLILRKGLRVLDIGCGNGSLFKIAEAKFHEVHGCDISLTALQGAKTTGMRTICLDLNTTIPLPYQNESFDAITCLEVLEHILDPFHLLNDLHRVLRPKGQVLLTTPNIRYFRNLYKLIFRGKFPHTTTDRFVWGGGHVHYFTRTDLAFLIQKAGFENIEFHLNQEQFTRSWKRRLIQGLTGKSIFGEWFCGGIIAEASKE